MNKDPHSFNLKKDNRQRGDYVESDHLPFSWKEHAYERLKALYAVGKALAGMDHMESIFPEVLRICSDTFPFLTAVLIEKRGKELIVFTWTARNIEHESIERTIAKAKESFIFLTNSSEADALELRKIPTDFKVIDESNDVKRFYTKKENACVVPFVVGKLPAFGIFMIEGALDLTENDLEFISALGDLISISVDRQYKTQFEIDMRKKEELEISEKLSHSKASILNLQSERDLREKFVSLLTHDLRTPLSVIKMNAQLINKNFQNPNLVQTYAIRINDSITRADQMITNLLDANRIRSGEKLPLHIELLDLNLLVEKTLNELAIVHSNRFILNAKNSLAGFWDLSGIRRVVENLCNNAVKYGSPEGPIVINIFEESSNAIIEVINSGDVISEADQKSLFQQFSRGRKNVLIKGWGIGLTLVRGVVESHGGSVKVVSTVDAGTIFTVKIPLDARPL